MHFYCFLCLPSHVVEFASFLWCNINWVHQLFVIKNLFLQKVFRNRVKSFFFSQFSKINQLFVELLSINWNKIFFKEKLGFSNTLSPFVYFVRKLVMPVPRKGRIFKINHFEMLWFKLLKLVVISAYIFPHIFRWNTRLRNPS